MTEISIVTINILIDLSLWKKRRPLLVDQLFELDADVIALQEVSLKEKTSTAHWLASELNQLGDDPENQYQVYLSPQTGQKSHQEAIAILSRLPVKRHVTIDLLTQNRVAQLVELRLEEGPLLLVNGHFYWQHGESEARQVQVELLLSFLDTQPAEIPVLVVGDLNSEPNMPSVDLMRRYFDSAHRAIHGEEPEFTCPTPLPNSRLDELRGNLLDFFGQESHANLSWQGTVDYIFVDPRLTTLECCLVFDKPDSQNPRIYPSDHYGLYALIEVN
jgi:endonuclease/exonuclease/phosphatase family metal-dependent hydrolase